MAIEFIFVGGIRNIDDLYNVLCFYVSMHDNEFNAFKHFSTTNLLTKIHISHPIISWQITFF